MRREGSLGADLPLSGRPRGDGSRAGERADEGRPYRGKSPQARRSERRRRLLDAGLELFGTVGYRSSSIEQICSAAGVTTRHFYEEYGCREELLKAVFTEVVMEASRAVTAAVEGAPFELDKRVAAGIAAYVTTMLADERRARVFCVEVVGVSPAMEAHRRSVLHLLAGMTQHYAEQLRVGEPIPYSTGRVYPSGLNFTYTTLAMVGSTNELMVEWMMGEREIELEELIGEIVKMYVTLALPMLGIEPRPELARS